MVSTAHATAHFAQHETYAQVASDVPSSSLGSLLSPISLGLSTLALASISLDLTPPSYLVT